MCRESKEHLMQQKLLISFLLSSSNTLPRQPRLKLIINPLLDPLTLPQQDLFILLCALQD